MWCRNESLPSGLIVLIALTPCTGLADTPVPPGHSTVHIVFISSHTPMRMDGQQTMAQVGNAVVPVDAIRPISISIDGKFVGHAMVGVWDIQPVFVLPEGLHKFGFAIDGIDPVSIDITVLGTGSKQYLVAKFPADDKQASVSGTRADGASSGPFDN
ncbi:hypothetical protein Q31b_25810 [Novipirellula aureliae]|uniref:DUF4397 domain-containing protein n=1 Tax=Novipirellula aureliae TaxID=2527966 RepID=A0A5C6E3Z4_9BACT|nr:hypothetical protein [Novipirellula aureliae]TWU43540.1 hypothetical protein Q31b_25810 [Novipirellula aureliae]